MTVILGWGEGVSEAFDWTLLYVNYDCVSSKTSLSRGLCMQSLVLRAWPHSRSSGRRSAALPS